MTSHKMEHLDPYLEELYFRSIMSVVDVEDVDGRQIVSVLIGQWNPNQKVSFPLDIIPKEIQVGITPNSFLIAYVNLDVETKEEYHVSPIDNLDKIGILPSSKTESPFGYYNISFFYLSIEDSEGGSIPYMDGMYLYEIDTKSTNNWTNGFNEELDEEENITTSDIINPEFIKKIKWQKYNPYLNYWAESIHSYEQCI